MTSGLVPSGTQPHPKEGRKKVESSSLEKTGAHPQAHPRTIYGLTHIEPPCAVSTCDSRSPHVLAKAGIFSPHLPATSGHPCSGLRAFAGKNQCCLQMALSFLLKFQNLGGFALGYSVSERPINKRIYTKIKIKFKPNIKTRVETFLRSFLSQPNWVSSEDLRGSWETPLASLIRRCSYRALSPHSLRASRRPCSVTLYCLVTFNLQSCWGRGTIVMCVFPGRTQKPSTMVLTRPRCQEGSKPVPSPPECTCACTRACTHTRRPPRVLRF